MSKICEQEQIIKYFILSLKYILPILLVIIGIIKLIVITKKTKARKRFIKYLLIAIIVFISAIILEIMLKNKFECISCIMENNCENKEEVKKENLENQNKEPETKPTTNTKPKPEEVIPKNTIEYIDGATYINGILIVNKSYKLDESYAPISSQGYNECNTCLNEETLNAFYDMQADAEALGLNIYISSGFRSYSYQEYLYNKYVARDGKQEADTYSARPGHSEHQTGLAFDLNTIDDSFANTAEGKWINDNCYRYGLILRYPKGKEEITGYQYESWHLRYVGKELAQKLYNNGNWMTLEEHFNITSKYE